MSKSVSGQNVEDMLSSVRRLVSSELPRNQRSRLPDGPGALVLTKDLRVQTAPPRAEAAPSSKTLEERIAELEAAVDHQESEWEPDGSEDQTVHQPDRIVFRPSRPLTEQEQRRPLRLSEIALIETGPANEGEAEDEGDEAATAEASFRHEGVDVEDTQPVEPEPAAPVESEAAAPEPESAESASAPAEPVSAQRFAQDPFADAIARDVAAVVAEMAEAALQEDRDFEAALAEAVRAAPAVAPMEDEAVAVAEDEPEADVEAEADMDLAFDDEADHVEAEAMVEELEAEVALAPEEGPEEAPEAQSREDRAQALDDLPAAAPLSEEQLRPLISRMIRDELQGELGERITRNVRKLVRQEINRALSVRDLE
ncbi:hypothetical protein GQ651_09115 [Alphaproteobacteria bacterium GH1-50]|uniref:Uncharacterized protein n=1 Tax=Kangsaoukella pontilimi TaxID=2691042 RepID=A0A7C9IG28_9RHOB|nr:hypothetical protein [Kangsaoukella pontilimi]MXQ08004.1 hypothetical protein [Kangsaoukella pontilimi]